ncbi:MAG: SDR family NAD(P)-dependent oxidoreductase [Thermoleophilia bacterium]|nr:SDR family NAD(P)-dependent oxidoreductase [Thermoleophilia bacterium]
MVRGLPKRYSLARRYGLAERYGHWALVAGASEGLGAAYARALAAEKLNLILAARRRSMLENLAAELGARFGVHTRVCAGDLAAPEFLAELVSVCADLELGVIVYNAAHSPVGEFLSLDVADVERIGAVNVLAPSLLLRQLVPGMLARGRGAVVLMSSVAGNQGSPNIAMYAATKAFNRVLAEGLWQEWKGRGIDVVACCAGAVRTPGYAETASGDAPGTLDPDEVARQTLARLGRGPVVIPGFVNQAASFLMTRLLPKRTAIAIMAGSTEGLAPKGSKQ